jgi:hypothetical protein
MHVASFCQGSTASLDLCAQELLDLWQHPIIIGERNFYVIVAQIVMDGPGRTKYCKCQGTNALAGCNICDVKGRTFKGDNAKGRRNVYDCHRRYLKPKDPRRLRESDINIKHNMHFVDDEKGKLPKKRSYEEYRKNGQAAEARGEAVEGVLGVWSLDILPYADLTHWTIDYVHTMNNVTTDSVNSMRPTYGGSNSKSKKHKKSNDKMYAHTNRTYTTSVVNACKKDDIHAHLYTGQRPPWVFSKQDCMLIDEKMTKLIGACSSEEVPLNIMRAGHMKRSHDTIHWANTFSNWCLSNVGPYTDNIIELFDIMSILNSSRIHGPTLKTVVYPRLIDALIKRSGLVPPSECCVTLHEMIHICEQVHEIGNPRNSLLYKFEKMNKVLKSFLNNNAKGNYV